MIDSELTNATPAHAAELASTMREADIRECLAAGYPDARSALDTALAHSRDSWALLINGEVAVIAGVTPVDGAVLSAAGIAEVWALTSRVVDKYPLTFFRWSRKFVFGLLQQYGLLANLVDARYQGAIDWLECLGFRIGQPQPHYITGAPFCLVSIGSS